jgi:hypothetical protein
MLERKNGDRLLLVLGVLFTIIALIAVIALVRMQSKAGVDTNQTVNTGNTDPVVDSVVVAASTGGSQIASFTPNEGAVKHIFVHGSVSDGNGCSDITSVDVTLFRTGVTYSCSANDNNCYTAQILAVALTNCSGAGDNTADYEADISVKNYVDPTDAGAPHAADTWEAYALVTDAAVATGDNSSGISGTSFEVASVAAFTLNTGTIDYGTLGLGDTSLEKTLTFTNTGNREVYSKIQADADMTSNLSGYSDIASTQVHYASTTAFTWTGADAVSKTGQTDFDIDLAQQLNGAAAPTKNGYFLLKMPSSGVNGTYANVLTLTATAI